MLNFHRKQAIFLYRWKNTKILPQIFFQVKNVIFFGDFGQKTWIAGPIIFKLSTKWNQVLLKKNLENENFMRTAVHCENWYFKKTNIFHYFPSKNLKYSQIFLSETIHAQENGSRGPHFAKSLNSNFLKGLTYSALVPMLLCYIWHIKKFLHTMVVKSEHVCKYFRHLHSMVLMTEHLRKKVQAEH